MVFNEIISKIILKLIYLNELWFKLRNIYIYIYIYIYKQSPKKNQAFRFRWFSAPSPLKKAKHANFFCFFFLKMDRRCSCHLSIVFLRKRADNAPSYSYN